MLSLQGGQNASTRQLLPSDRTEASRYFDIPRKLEPIALRPLMLGVQILEDCEVQGD
jgi:hypothetical protein